MEPEIPLIQGILLLPAQGVLSQLKKSWHKRFCQLFKASNYGIERLEIYDNHEEAILQLHSPRIVTLEACVKIAPSNHSHVFTVVTKSGVHYFGCCSVTEMYKWISAFQLVAFKDKLAKHTIEENTDLYCTSGEGVFSVKVVETDASKRCGLETRTYTLVIAAVDIKLMDGDVVLFSWPYKYIRRYGYRDGKFTFEAGRKCESGEGSFSLEHGSQQEIFRCVYSKVKSMKKLLNGDNSPNIECNDTQYHAALCMEAGSRSPLPPSPNSSANLIDMDFTATTPNSQKQLNSSSSSDSTPASRPSPPIIKPKPAKPPRKNIFTGLLDKKSTDSDALDSSSSSSSDQKHLINTNSPESSQKSVSGSLVEEKHSYDLVEVRSDAWKTHGTDNVHHTEKYNSPSIRNSKDKENNEDYQYETMMPGNVSQTSPKTKSNTCETISISSSMFYTSCKTPDVSDYDELQNFGSASKLIPVPTRKIAAVPTTTQSTHTTYQNTVSNSTADSNVAWSIYDIVEDISSVRLADDSHLGYAVVRKKAPSEATSINTNMGPKPKAYADSEYAIVSKPKRV